MGTIEPEGRLIITAANLDSAVAFGIGEGLNFHLQFEIFVFTCAHQPDVVMVTALGRCSRESSVFHRPVFFVLVLGLTFDFPSNREIQPPSL